MEINRPNKCMNRTSSLRDAAGDAYVSRVAQTLGRFVPIILVYLTSKIRVWPRNNKIYA